MVAAFRRRTGGVEALLPLEMWTYWAEIKKNDYRKKGWFPIAPLTNDFE
jgi:hypothetical protein